MQKVRNRIGRSIFETHCIGSRYDPKERKVIQFSEVLQGNVRDVERAAVKLKRKFGCKDLVVEELHHFQTYVSAPLEKFMEIVDERTEKEID